MTIQYLPPGLRCRASIGQRASVGMYQSGLPRERYKPTCILTRQNVRLESQASCACCASATNWPVRFTQNQLHSLLFGAQSRSLWTVMHRSPYLYNFPFMWLAIKWWKGTGMLHHLRCVPVLPEFCDTPARIALLLQIWLLKSSSLSIPPSGVGVYSNFAWPCNAWSHWSDKFTACAHNVGLFGVHIAAALRPHHITFYETSQGPAARHVGSEFDNSDAGMSTVESRLTLCAESKATSPFSIHELLPALL